MRLHLGGNLNVYLFVVLPYSNPIVVEADFHPFVDTCHLQLVHATMSVIAYLGLNDKCHSARSIQKHLNMCFVAEIRDICYFGKICRHFRGNCGTSGYPSNQLAVLPGYLVHMSTTFHNQPKRYQTFYVFHSTLNLIKERFVLIRKKTIWPYLLSLQLGSTVGWRNMPRAV